MATKYSGLDDIKREITCDLCSKEFLDPRSLTCHHVYCRSCLEILASKRNNIDVMCPECNKVTPLLAGGVTGLGVSIQKEKLKKIAEKMIEKAVEEEDVSSYCVHHADIPCDLYCHQCQQYVCHNCILIGGKHVQHYCEKKEDVAKIFRQAFNNELPSLLQRQEDIQKSLDKLHKSQQLLQTSCEAACEKISKSYDEIIGIVEEKKKEEIEQFCSKYEADVGLKELKSHEKFLSSLSHEIESIQRRVKRDDDLCSDVQFMESKKEMLRDIRQTKRRINRLPTEPPNYKHNAICMPTLGLGLMENIRQKIPQMYQFIAPLKCIVKAMKGKVNEKASVTVRYMTQTAVHACFHNVFWLSYIRSTIMKSVFRQK